MEELIVKVTRDDIRRGKKESGASCPIARAVRRLGSKKAIFVSPFDMEVGKMVFIMPRQATKFVFQFDDGEKVKPFTFVAKRID